MQNMDDSKVKVEEIEKNEKGENAKTHSEPFQQQPHNTAKTPIYKKWWFWLIIGILFISAVFGSQGDDSSTGNHNVGSASSNESDKSNSNSNIIWKSAGTYKVGKDIKAGEYFVKCTSYNCYVQVSSDSSGRFDSIIANDNISTHTYITVRDGEYLTVTGGKFASAENVDPQKPNSDGAYEDGMYKIGKDIPEGEYKVIATNSCYIEISSNSNHTFNSIISNNNIEVGTSTYITVSNGEYLKVSGGKIISE